MTFLPAEELKSPRENLLDYSRVPCSEMMNSLPTNSHFMPMDAYGSFHTTDSLNADAQFEDLCQSTSYSSDGQISASLLNIEFDNDRDEEWTWNDSLDDSPVNVGFTDYFGSFSSESCPSSEPSLPTQLSQPLASCEDKHVIDLNGNPENLGRKQWLQNETFSGSLLESISDSSLSEMSCSGMKNIERMPVQYLQARDSLPMSFPTLYQSSLPASCQFIHNKKLRVYNDSERKDELLTTLWPHHSSVDEDPDVCIIDDFTNTNTPVSQVVSQVVPPRYGVSSAYQPRTTSSVLQSNDDKLAFKIALQVLACSSCLLLFLKIIFFT